MRKWAPNFRASEVSFDFVAKRMRVPELLIEYYDPNILTNIGRSLGGLLWIDNFTMSSERGKITILCMQVNMNKPLRKSFMMEGRKQYITYEGIDALCFRCGSVGHKLDTCTQKLQTLKEKKVVKAKSKSNRKIQGILTHDRKKPHSALVEKTLLIGNEKSNREIFKEKLLKNPKDKEGSLEKERLNDPLEGKW
ncbi:hypothetical protein Godav_009145 [Gossypium davidsonii]|uniref:CCHC-type domain-containing protein n=2 Tax=Gossypium TaxID=3633 RepID=A0A7J8SDP7_GOSDV|nr:hypothetical protein [Gossypium davidsonii]